MNKPKPTPRQLEWADMEIGVIIHYLVTIYNPDFEDYKTKAVRTQLPPEIITPTDLNPEQWVRSAYEAGAKYAVMVVNHCDGFSFWQTKVNDYSCASLKWKDGKGDVFREFVDACKKYGIRPGVYYSTGCNGYYDINDEEEQDYSSEKNRAFVKCVERQIEEIWSEYGEMFEIWFDGGIVPHEKGGPDVYSILKKHQPNAIAFQGPVGYPNNVRWVGNEDGYAPPECWSTYDYSDTCAGSPDGSLWMPAETDFPNRTHEAYGGGWGWREGDEKYALSPEELLNCYVRSVGRNTNMLIGMGIGTDGRFQDEQQFIDFGKLLKKTFAQSLCETKDVTASCAVLGNSDKKPLGYLVIEEDITEGHFIKGFSVFADGEKIAEGECVGHKRIIPLDGCTASEIKLVIDKADEGFRLRSAALYTL